MREISRNAPLEIPIEIPEVRPGGSSERWARCRSVAVALWPKVTPKEMPKEIRGSSGPRRHARSATTPTTLPSYSFSARAALPIPFSVSLSPLVPCAGLLRAVFEDVCRDRRASGEAQTRVCQLSALMTPECTCACSRVCASPLALLSLQTFPSACQLSALETPESN